MRQVALLVSVVFHPLLLPFYLTLLLYSLRPVSLVAYSGDSLLILSLLVLVYTVLFPAVFIFIRYKQQKISDVQVLIAEERTVPYLFTLSMMLLLIFTFYRLRLPIVMISGLLGATFSLAATILINLRWKISAHTVGIGGLLTFIVLIHDQLTYQSPGLLPSLLLGAGLVGTSRLVMQAHSLAQVAAGYLVGAIGVAAGVFML